MDNELNSIALMSLSAGLLALASAELLRAWTEKHRDDDDDDTGGEGGTLACP